MYIDSTFDAVRPDGDQYLAAELRRALEPLLLRHGVDATWHGHHHSYQRTCPLAGGRCLASGEDGVAAGPVHIVLGEWLGRSEFGWSWPRGACRAGLGYRMLAWRAR